MVKFRIGLVEYLIAFGIGFFHSLRVSNKLPSGNLSAIFSRYESKEAPCLFEAFHKRKKL